MAEREGRDMTTYRITGRDTEIGTYEGASPLDAYRAMLRDAGYRDAAAAASAGIEWDTIPADVTVAEAETIRCECGDATGVRCEGSEIVEEA